MFASGWYLGRGIGLTEDAFEDLARVPGHVDETSYLHQKTCDNHGWELKRE